MKNYWSNVKGYLVILVEGKHVERFINLAVRKGINIWDAVKINENKMKMKIYQKDFKELRDAAFKTECEVRITRKVGVPFLINSYKRRKAFMIGLIAFLFLTIYLNSFIWNIEITGLKNIKKSYITKILKDNGIREGMFKYGIEPKKIQQNILIQAKGIVWIGIKIKGTAIGVNVVEGTNPPKIIDKESPCSIIAKKEGVIENIITSAGKNEAAKGDSVLRGQVIISGFIPVQGLKEGQYRYVHAYGQVLARTWYEIESTVKYKNKKTIATGNEKNKYALVLFNNYIPFYFNNKSYKICKKKVYKDQLRISRNTYLPFAFIRKNFKEQKKATYYLNSAQVKEKIKENIQSKIHREIPKGAKIVSKKIKFFKVQGGIKGVNVVECIEEIGEEQSIDVNNIKNDAKS